MLHVHFIIGFRAIPKILINRSLVKTIITEKSDTYFVTVLFTL